SRLQIGTPGHPGRRIPSPARRASVPDGRTSETSMPVRLLPWSETQIGCVLSITLLALVAAGCGKESGKRDVAADSADEEVTEGEAVATPHTKARKSAANKKGAAAGKKIGGIPIDVWPEVWFKDPLAVAAEKGSTAGAAPAATGDSDRAVAKAGAD